MALLAKHISEEYVPSAVATRLSMDISSAVKGVLIEYNYIDKDYRSTFYHFYAKKGQLYSADCVRLHFFDQTVSYDQNLFTLTCNEGKLGDHYFGYMVLRPTGLATIGRSVFSADVRNGVSGSIITAKHKVHLLGYELYVEGFPSMDQHIDISVCAHAACWSILRHYSVKYNLYREFHTHDITMMAQQFNPGGLVPSKGLTILHAERVFQQAGTFPVNVYKSREDADPDLSFYRQLLAYVESGFPLFASMTAIGHAIAVVGLEWQPKPETGNGPRFSWDQLKSLVVVDDNHLPYCNIPVNKAQDAKYSAQDIDGFIVALPEKVFYPADAVDKLATSLYRLQKYVSLPPQNEAVIRYFITTGSSLRSFMRDHVTEFDSNLVATIMSLPLAQFVWIVEYATHDEWQKNQISARAIVDATASLHENTPLWLFHNRERAFVFDRRKVGAQNSTQMLELSGMEKTSLSRFKKNLRVIQHKI
ncbi:MAG: hypothetical protein ACXWJK_08860 [Burkholderiaceae bacterium]